MWMVGIKDKKYSFIGDVLAMGKTLGKEKSIDRSRSSNSSNRLPYIADQGAIQGIRHGIFSRTRTGKGTTSYSAASIKRISNIKSELS